MSTQCVLGMILNIREKVLKIIRWNSPPYSLFFNQKKEVTSKLKSGYIMSDGTKCYERKLSGNRMVIINIFWINEEDWECTVLSRVWSISLWKYHWEKKRVWSNIYSCILVVGVLIGTISIKKNLPKGKLFRPSDSLILHQGIYSTGIFVHNSDVCLRLFLLHCLY